MSTENPDIKVTIAKKLYEAYCAGVGGKAFNGDPLPMWEEFAADENKKVQSAAWLSLGALVESQTQTSLEIFKIALESKVLKIEHGDIVLVTVPNAVPITPELKANLSKTFTNLLHDKGARVLIKHDDFKVEMLADALTAPDIARMLDRIDDKKLSEPVPPVQEDKVDIILNGRPAKSKREASYEDIIVAVGYKPDDVISVTYCGRRNGDSQRSGMLSKGKTVTVEPGMIFNAMHTGNA